MECFDHIEIRPGGHEEYLEHMSEEFPYLLVLSDHDRYQGRTVPWHWHREIEMYYGISGEVECTTPHERAVVGPGDVGFVNANVLHTTRAVDDAPGSRIYVHMFQPSLLGHPGSLLAREFVDPLCAATSVELLTFSAGDPASASICGHVRDAVETALAEEEGWQLVLRAQLSLAWHDLLQAAGPLMAGGAAAMPSAQGERLKLMLDFIGLHYPEHIEVGDIAAAGFTSERECHRTFQDCLGTTPAAYLRDYRIEQACRMLAHTTRPVGDVGAMAGLGTASRFAANFRARMGCTPSQYRSRWQKQDISRRYDC